MSWRIAIPVMSGPEILASGRASVVAAPSACMRTAVVDVSGVLKCLLDALQSVKRAMTCVRVLFVGTGRVKRRCNPHL